MRPTLLAAAALIALVAAPAHAALTVFTGIFSGAQEVPPRVTPGTGSGTAIYDDVASTLAVSIDFGGLLSPTRDGHIHCCTTPDMNVTVAIGFTPTGFPIGVTEGSYDNVFNLLDIGIYNANFLAAAGGTAIGARDRLVNGLEDGLAYFNIHTNQFPGGEIRANIDVPAPAALALFGLGVVALGAFRRR